MLAPVNKNLADLDSLVRSVQNLASVLEGQLYVGDLILQVNDTPTAKSTGRAFAERLHGLENETYRTLAVRN